MAIIVFAFIGFLIYSEIVISKTFKNEKTKYKLMIQEPTDITVKMYMSALEKTSGFFCNWAYSVKSGPGNKINDQLRQSQGWEIIRDCSTVSETVKNDFKKLLIIQGVKVQ